MSHIDPRIVISWMALHTVIATGLGSDAVLVETDRYPPLLLRVAWHVALWAFPPLGVYLLRANRDFFKGRRAWAVACMVFSFWAWAAAAGLVGYALLDNA